MSDIRDTLVVRVNTSGYTYEDGFRVEPMNFARRFGVGLYVMVPVKNDAEAESLQKRLRDNS